MLSRPRPRALSAASPPPPGSVAPLLAAPPFALSLLALPLLALSLLAAPAAAAPVAPAAAPTGRPLTLRYQAPDGCPDAAAFLAAVRLRAPDARLAAPGESAPSYGISIRSEGDLAVGRLAIEGATGGDAREVRGDSCSETAAALAFVVALSLTAHEAAPASGSAALAAGSASASLPAGVSPWPGPPPGIYVRPWAASVGAGVTATSAIAPGVSAGAEIAGEVVFSAVSFAPSLRLGGVYGASGVTDAGPGRASFRLVAVRLDGCPVSARLGGLRLAPCVGYEVGSLRARGQGVDVPASGARSWQAVHLDARAHWRPFGPTRLLHPWFVELTAGLVLPLTSRTFVFDTPPTDVFTVPRVAGSGAASVGVHFP